MASGELVVDASVVSKWLFRGEDLRAKAKDLIADFTKRKTALIAPRIIIYEVESNIQLKFLKGIINLREANTCVDKFRKVGITIEEPQGLVDKAREIARLTRQERIYDSLYAALAELRGCDFWTADKKFHDAANKQFASVRFLADYN
jgi:predicted nucleic acid-binding protein